MMHHRSKYLELRSKGMTYRQIASVLGVTHQAAHYACNPNYKFKKSGVKVLQTVSGLEVDVPVFVPGAIIGSFTWASYELGVRTVRRSIERGGVRGVWVCRI